MMKKNERYKSIFFLSLKGYLYEYNQFCHKSSIFRASILLILKKSTYIESQVNFQVNSIGITYKSKVIEEYSFIIRKF